MKFYYGGRKRERERQRDREPNRKTDTDTLTVPDLPQAAYDLNDEKWDVHTLTGTFKLFFRELQQPLIPENFFASMRKILKDKESKEKSKIFTWLRNGLNGRRGVHNASCAR